MRDLENLSVMAWTVILLCSNLLTFMLAAVWGEERAKYDQN